MPDLQLLAISGSLRNISTNTALLRAACQVAPSGIHIKLYNGMDRLPHFNPDIDVEPFPDTATLLRDAVTRADGVLIACPEYAHSVPGSMKNLLDWLVGSPAIVNKPVALLNAAPRASIAQAQLAETLRTMSAWLVSDASITLPIAGSGLNAEGIAAHPDIAPRLRAALETFGQAIRAHA